MQKLYNYTRYFQPSKTYTDEYLPRFIDALKSLDKELKTNPIEESRFFFKEWGLPYGQDVSHYYYNILFAFAKFMKVKLMWRNFIDGRSMGGVRGVMIIGDENRIELMAHMLTHYFKAEASYLLWLKDNKRVEAKASTWGNMRVYSSKVIEAQRDIISAELLKLLEADVKYDNRLENYILEQFDLNAKLYKTQKKIYYHTITNQYVHKRMLL